MVYNTNEYWFKGMDKLKTYYFSIEAINESGVSARSKVMKVE
jgi:xylan 1,4-beta-xylosidase